MFGALDTSTSALIAHRTRMDVISANLANANSIDDGHGNNVPFRRRLAILSPGESGSVAGRNRSGVHVREIELDPSNFRKAYEPDHPLADDAGYVSYPNIDPMTEQINALEVARAYEANIQAAEATKTMMQAALRLLA
ncbi:MAG: flagellar basal body rod protein FlgC [Algisphaera sp.]